MNTKIKLSIIIPVYNAEKFIERCLFSLYNQDLTTDEYEIIIINDGSTDNSLEKINAVKRSNTFVFSQTNQKQGAARNRGIEMAKGKYIWFVDADDYVETNIFALLISKMEEYKLDMLCFNSKTTNKYIDIIEKGIFYIRNKAIYLHPWASIYKTELFYSHNLKFKENVVYEDNEFMPRIYYYSERVMYSNVIAYHVGEDNATSTTRNKEVPYWLLSGLLYNVVDMGEFSDKVYENDKKTAVALYYYTSLTFNTFMLKYNMADVGVKKKINRLFIQNRKYFIKMFILSKELKYIGESVLLIMPLRIFSNVINGFKK